MRTRGEEGSKYSENFADVIHGGPLTTVRFFVPFSTKGMNKSNIDDAWHDLKTSRIAKSSQSPSLDSDCSTNNSLNFIRCTKALCFPSRRL